MIQLSNIQGFFKVTVNCKEVSKNLIAWHSERIIDRLGRETMQDILAEKVP